MKIYPRRLRIINDGETTEITIKNSSGQDRILLFRVRRAAEQLLSFTPKKGFVLPGESVTIRVTALNAQFIRTRLLIRLTCVPVVEVLQDFEQAYHLGTTLLGEVKKLIDVFGTESDERDFKSQNCSGVSTTSRASHISESDREFNMSTGSVTSFSMVPQTISHSLSKSRLKDGRYSKRQNSKEDEEDEVEERKLVVNRDEEKSSVQTPVIHDPTTTALLALLNSASKSDKERLFDVIRQQIVKDTPSDLGDKVSLTQPTAFTSDGHSLQLPPVPSMSPTQTLRQSLESDLNDLRELAEKVSKSSSRDIELNMESIDRNTLAVSKSPSQDRVDRNELADLSRVQNTEKLSAHSLSPSVSVTLSEEETEEDQQSSVFSQSSDGETVTVIEQELTVYGSNIDNYCCVKLCEEALSNVQRQRKRVTALTVSQTTITSIKHSVAAIFDDKSRHPQPSENRQLTAIEEETEKEIELRELRSAMFEESLLSISISQCTLSLIDDSLGRFELLTSLSLTHCHLRSLSTAFSLPSLTSIDLSFNLLRSLDGLQGLLSLTTLTATNNRIGAARDATTVLVPLARTLTAIDLRENPVSDFAKGLF
jgi:hypothetical protein